MPNDYIYMYLCIVICEWVICKSLDLMLQFLIWLKSWLRFKIHSDHTLTFKIHSDHEWPLSFCLIIWQYWTKSNKNIYCVTWGPPRVKVRQGKVSWTEGQSGMLLSYFVLIKLSVIKCLFITTMHLISYINC